MTKTKEELFEAAVDKWGIPLQVAVLLEELAELQAAVARLVFRGRGSLQAVALELADVEITTGQLAVILKRLGLEERELQGIRALRLDRLEGLLSVSGKAPHD
jgi:NTP pyrophosphatase (non-canonical NTP hydrolase)